MSNFYAMAASVNQPSAPSIADTVSSPAHATQAGDAPAPVPSAPPEQQLQQAEASLNATTSEYAPTVAFAIPLPPIPDTPAAAKAAAKNQIPPFILYTPPKAPLKAPPKAADGEAANGTEDAKKESLVMKAQRKWQEEEKGAREQPNGFKSKAVKLIGRGMSATKNSKIEFLVRTPDNKQLKELKIIYPASYSVENMKERFEQLIKAAKSGAIKSGVVATAALPFVLAFDMVTFITGPAEINAVWAGSSWIGASRASSIANGITGGKLDVSFSSSEALDDVARRLHEICWEKAKKPGIVARPQRAGSIISPTPAAEDVPPSLTAPLASGNEHISTTAAEADPTKPPALPPRPSVDVAGTGAPPPVAVQKRGAQLAGVLLEEMERFGGDLEQYQTDKTLVSQDLHNVLVKGAKEWLKTVT